MIAAARATLARFHRPPWHRLAAAIRGRDGKISTGIHLGATIGRLSICAEAVALGRAIMEGDGRIAVIAALRAPKPGEAGREPALVAPCGACREMIFDFDPEALVILPHPEHGAVKLPIRALLPVPYPRFPAAGPD